MRNGHTALHLVKIALYALILIRTWQFQDSSGTSRRTQRLLRPLVAHFDVF